MIESEFERRLRTNLWKCYLDELGLAWVRCDGRGAFPILRDGQVVSAKLSSITLRHRGCTSEEPDGGKPHVRFCEGTHSNLGAITPIGGAL